jgi:hypothetical protein
MKMQKQSKAKQYSIMAMTAALFAIFFLLSRIVALPNFTFLYLPIVLLGVFPIWFGWYGLVGSMIGAFIGAIYVENLPFYLGWVEITTAFIIYSLNWLLIPKVASEAKTKRGLVILSSAYALSLFVGTCVIIWQFVSVGLFPNSEIAWAFVLPTFILNLPIVLIACPALIRAVSPKLKTWGLYSGNFAEWRSSKVKS